MKTLLARAWVLRQSPGLSRRGRPPGVARGSLDFSRAWFCGPESEPGSSRWRCPRVMGPTSKVSPSKEWLILVTQLKSADFLRQFSSGYLVKSVAKIFLCTFLFLSRCSFLCFFLFLSLNYITRISQCFPGLQTILSSLNWVFLSFNSAMFFF